MAVHGDGQMPLLCGSGGGVLQGGLEDGCGEDGCGGDGHGEVSDGGGREAQGELGRAAVLVDVYMEEARVGRASGGEGRNGGDRQGP